MKHPVYAGVYFIISTTGQFLNFIYALRKSYYLKRKKIKLGNERYFNKQPISFQNCFGVPSQLSKEKGSK
jgi:hypothetical protein